MFTPLLTCRPAGGGGVTDHGLLTGLGDDDHAQYALADKTRPSPWVAAANLTARSLADLGTRDHHLTTGLSDDDHAQYALLLGRAGGQKLFGDTASGGHLYLQSTAHATRGYVKIQDDLQLLTNYIRGSDDTTRLTLAAATPHVTFTGDVYTASHMGVGLAGAPATTAIFRAVDDMPAQSISYAAYVKMYGTGVPGDTQSCYGLFGGAYQRGTPDSGQATGLSFIAAHETASLCNYLRGIYINVQSAAAGSGALTESIGLYIGTAGWTGSKPTTATGIRVNNQGNAAVTTAYGLRILDQTATTVYLLEIGSTPYLRLVGGAAPAANCTHLWLAEGATPTLRNLQWKLYSALVAGDRVAVLV
jgi:hypothetical protein